MILPRDSRYSDITDHAVVDSSNIDMQQDGSAIRPMMVVTSVSPQKSNPGGVMSEIFEKRFEQLESDVGQIKLDVTRLITRSEEFATKTVLADLNARSEEFATKSALAELTARSEEFATKSALAELTARSEQFATKSALAELIARSEEFATKSVLAELMARSDQFATKAALAELAARCEEFVTKGDLHREISAQTKWMAATLVTVVALCMTAAKFMF